MDQPSIDHTPFPPNRHRSMSFGSTDSTGGTPCHFHLGERTTMDARPQDTTSRPNTISESEDTYDSPPSPTRSELSERSSRDMSWYVQNTYTVIPPFTRLGLSAPGVVLPLTVKEYWRRKTVGDFGNGEGEAKRRSIRRRASVGQDDTSLIGYVGTSSQFDASSIKLTTIAPAHFPLQSGDTHDANSTTARRSNGSRSFSGHMMSRRSLTSLEDLAFSEGTISDVCLPPASEYASSISTSRTAFDVDVSFSCVSPKTHVIKVLTGGNAGITELIPGADDRHPPLKAKSFLGRLKTLTCNRPIVAKIPSPSNIGAVRRKA